ncbi:hypothetical protein DUI87_07283 [Hirundo rustica rustica]|uniref:Uncharacterized protein n=1 Tax=Hirundo rustica rustica TaxID=333673 RepID=A0A3M0KPE1_HIRRU|nr:hypothetical protein DUI87_07283 [Hirundo rustica rustica]
MYSIEPRCFGLGPWQGSASLAELLKGREAQFHTSCTTEQLISDLWHEYCQRETDQSLFKEKFQTRDGNEWKMEGISQGEKAAEEQQGNEEGIVYFSAANGTIPLEEETSEK